MELWSKDSPPAIPLAFLRVAQAGHVEGKGGGGESFHLLAVAARKSRCVDIEGEAQNGKHLD